MAKNKQRQAKSANCELSPQSQQAETERMAAIGKLTAKVAHELNNPMDGILRYINLSLRSLENNVSDKPYEYLLHCRQGLLRMIEIVREILEFSRNNYPAFEYTDINTIIEDAIRLMQTKADTSNINIVTSLSGELPKVRSGNLFQVFCNLIKNAIDAMPDGGDLQIRALTGIDGTISIQFADTGPGFDPELSETLFEPFFTTKADDKGTGLGLAISRDIIEQYNGSITAKNDPNGGSIFTVTLPVKIE